MTVPEKLEDWTLPAIRHLLVSGYSESDRFDFKAMLPVKGEVARAALRRAACSFANSRGGFLVFGVGEKGQGGERLLGIPASRENTKFLTDLFQAIEPALVMNPSDPPLQLDNGNVALVVEIPRGRRGPHWSESDRKFYKRAHSSAVEMSHDEVRMAFIDHAERVGRVKLVYLSLIDNWVRLEDAVKPEGSDSPLPLTGLDLTQVRSYLGEIQALCPELLGGLLMLLRECDAISTRISQLALLVLAEYKVKQYHATHHKGEISFCMERLGPRFDWVLTEMQKTFGFEPVSPRGPGGPAIPPVPTWWQH